jgi:hypothetical protein
MTAGSAVINANRDFSNANGFSASPDDAPGSELSDLAGVY